VCTGLVCLVGVFLGLCFVLVLCDDCVERQAFGDGIAVI
jgi:hypothetical protein